MVKDEIPALWSTLTHRNTLSSNAHAPAMPRSFDEEEGGEACSSDCSPVDDDDFPGPPRFYRNQSHNSNRREHHRQRRFHRAVTTRFGGNRVRRRGALRVALCVSATSLVWIITRDGNVPFPLLSLLGPWASGAREMNSTADVARSGWEPDDVMQGSMATVWSPRLEDGATPLNDLRSSSGWLRRAENFKIPSDKVDDEPRVIDRVVRTFSRIASDAAAAAADFVAVTAVTAQKKHRAGGGGIKSSGNAKEPPNRPIDWGAPVQVVGLRENGLREERLSAEAPIDVHKAVAADAAVAPAGEKQSGWNGRIIAGRLSSKLIEGDVENPHLHETEGKGGRDAWEKDRGNEAKDSPVKNTGGSIRSDGGGVPREARLSGGRGQERAQKGPADDHQITPHKLSSIKKMTSNAVHLLAQRAGERGGQASPLKAAENAVINGTLITSPALPSSQRAEGKKLASTRTEGGDLKKKITVGDAIHLTHRVGTVDDVGRKGREEGMTGEEEKKPKAEGMENEEEKKQEVKEIINRGKGAAAAIAAVEEENQAKQGKRKKTDVKNYKEALPSERDDGIDGGDSGKRDMSRPDSKPQQQGQTKRQQKQQKQQRHHIQQQQLQLQRTGDLTEPSPALLPEPVNAAATTAATATLKETARARAEISALRIEPVETKAQAAHLAAAAAAGEEGHEEGLAEIKVNNAAGAEAARLEARGNYVDSVKRAVGAGDGRNSESNGERTKLSGEGFIAADAGPRGGPHSNRSGGGGARARSTGEDEGVRAEKMPSEGRDPGETGNRHQTTTVTRRPQRGEFVVDNEERLRVRPPSRNASRWAQARGTSNDDRGNEKHPPLPPPPPAREQIKKTGTDDGARASEEAGRPCRLRGRVDRWEPPEAADLRATYRWKDEQKASMGKIRRFSKGGNELRDLIHSEVVRLDILRHDLFCL